MCTEDLNASRLYALIGESSRLLPGSAIASLELILARLDPPAAPPTPNAISNVCPGAASTLQRKATEEGLGYQERDALSAILEILHSAQQERGEGFGGSLDDRLVEGLIVAGRLIVA